MARPNPSACCGVSVDCCPNRMKEVLTATFENVSTCPCIDGMQATLVWDPIAQWWVGYGTGSGCSLAQERYVLACVTPKAGCTDFSFSTSNGSCMGGPAAANAGCACDPLNLVFDLSLTGLNCCDSFFGSGSVRITVTE